MGEYLPGIRFLWPDICLHSSFCGILVITEMLNGSTTDAKTDGKNEGKAERRC